jgi:hypothetical protein
MKEFEMMENNESQRILAREVADVRELSFEELQLVAGGGNSTGDPGTIFNPGGDCGPGWGLTFWQRCLSSDDDPCDMTVDETD